MELAVKVVPERVLAVLAAEHQVLLETAAVSVPVAGMLQELSLAPGQPPYAGQVVLLEQTRVSAVPGFVRWHQMIEVRAKVRRQWLERCRGLGPLRPRYPI